MSHLSIAQCAGQVIVAGFGALGPSPDLCGLARAGQLAGFVLFRRNLRSLAEVAEQNALLRSLAPDEPPLWIAVDQEGGRVARLGAPLVQLPPARVLGSLDDLELTRDAAHALGESLSLLGFNLDFAPVLDVDTNPDNPVIGDRSFSNDPAQVIRHAGAFATGLARAEVAGCGKHFPGHGDTQLDSHFALPVLPHARERLDRVELAPFAALSGSLPSIMTAHVVFQSIDATRPGTLSRDVIELLRQQLGFNGLVFSDDLEMKAVSDSFGVAEAACLAIEAGCDQVLICEHEEHTLHAHAALVERAEREPAFARRLTEAAERGRRMRMRFWPRPVVHLNEAELTRRLLEIAAPIEHRIEAALT
ncbi:MAG TPA: beta-N-acetylhexosaminidase [Polyangiales bacterium]|nr:beta-N-acetylhexosaminidase [Polyangiales bacterium]